MTSFRNAEMEPGNRVILIGVPTGLVDDLPEQDQRAIAAAIGTWVSFVGWDDDDRAEIQFEDEAGGTHFLFVDPSFLSPG